MGTRRTVLKLLGGGLVVAATGVGGFVAANGPSSSARAPWRNAGQYDDPRLNALSYAILAPNPHNRQPWAVRLEGADGLTVFCDLERRLPATDPLDRQISLGFGAFLELLAISAAQSRFGVEITPFPEGEGAPRLDARPIAHVRLVEGGAEPDPLFLHILNRRTNRETYTGRTIPEEALGRLVEASRVYGVFADATLSAGPVDQLRDLTWRAHVREMETALTHKESIDLMRIGAGEVSANPDGISLEGPMIAAGSLMGQISRKALLDPRSEASQQGLAMYRERALSARGFLWLANENQTRTDQLNAGRAYARMTLAATALGLAVHPWSQALQEYSEMADLYEEVHNLIGDGRTLQMLVRLGYAKGVGSAPRWPLETRLVS